MRNIRVRLLLLSCLFLVLAGCAAPPKPPRILWPPPPGHTYLEFLGVYYSQDNFPKTADQKAMESLVGRPDLVLFQMPTGIVSDGEGHVYVADAPTGNIRVYDFNERTVEFLTKEPVMVRPVGLALDSAGNLYAADPAGGKVVVFSPDRRILRVIGDAKNLTRPAYLAINEKLGRIYVSDSKENRIVVFDMQGKHLFNFGERGVEKGQLYVPQGMAIDKEDRVFVAEQLNARVQVFDADGKALYFFGERGDREWQFENPRDLAFDSDGNLNVVDYRKGALMTFRADGTPLLFTGGGDKFGPLSFLTPGAISIDKNDTICVADALNKRFSMWQAFTEAYLKRHPEDRNLPPLIKKK